GAAGRQIGPNVLISNDGVMSERPSHRRARLAQAASLHGTTHPDVRTFLTSCRLRGVDQSIPTGGIPDNW
ncbi:MAG: hypothetical protein WAV67_04030, partial [Dokdonella sp.]